MNINIRHENISDYKLVEEVARDAFWNLYIPGAVEHVAVNKMRSSKDFIPELSFVIEVDNKIAGAILYTHSKIVNNNGDEFNTISFGPVFISPEFHRMGLGRKLITHSIEEAKKLGHKAIMTLGYDYHYTPYGFMGGKKYNVSMPDGNFYKGLLVLPLYEGALDNVSGHAIFSSALDVTEEEIEAFESNLPFKEKKVQDSQEEFARTVIMLDEKTY